MKLISNAVEFPIKLAWPDGTCEHFVDVADLECNLEDFDSNNPMGAIMLDAKDRRVYLKLSMTWVEKLELLNGN